MKTSAPFPVSIRFSRASKYSAPFRLSYDLLDYFDIFRLIFVPEKRNK